MKKQNLNEIKNNKDKEKEDWLELFDSKKITFYDFNPEKETFSEACERIRKRGKEKIKLKYPLKTHYLKYKRTSLINSIFIPLKQKNSLRQR